MPVWANMAVKFLWWIDAGLGLLYLFLVLFNLHKMRKDVKQMRAQSQAFRDMVVRDMLEYTSRNPLRRM